MFSTSQDSSIPTLLENQSDRDSNTKLLDMDQLLQNESLYPKCVFNHRTLNYDFLKRNSKLIKVPVVQRSKKIKKKSISIQKDDLSVKTTILGNSPQQKKMVVNTHKIDCQISFHRSCILIGKDYQANVPIVQKEDLNKEEIRNRLKCLKKTEKQILMECDGQMTQQN